MDATASTWQWGRWKRRVSAVRRGASLAAWGLLVVAVLFAANWVYQVVRKPTELLGPVGSTLGKSPRATWTAYGALFRAHSTDIMSPELLAALAQVEGQGNPLAQTYWRWKLTLNPFEIYRPASSAVGMFQITDGTFAEARRYCVRNHAVIRDGPWYDFESCWFNSLYSRVVPSHAVELTAAYLHQAVVELLAKHVIARATLEQQQTLAAVVHLCGKQRGDAFARRGFRLQGGERCGSHDLGRYVHEVRRLRAQFVRYGREGG